MIIWLVANAHWIIPVAYAGYSEWLGYKSGSNKATVFQNVLGLFKVAATSAAEKNDPASPGGPNDKLD